MSSIGPQLPSAAPEKRKLDGIEHGSKHDSASASASDIGPALPTEHEAARKRPRIVGPSLPTSMQIARDGTKLDRSSAGEEEEEEEDDDDDFGPCLPTEEEAFDHARAQPSSVTVTSNADANAITTKRDDWMMVPPSGGDWSARIDPTKLKSRKFNTGKGAKGPSTGGDATSTWHETPAEKQARLQREMMGIRDGSVGSTAIKSNNTDTSDVETAKRMNEYNKARGPTLYASHQKTQTEEDDDPSARAFDREKDIGGGLQINATKRKEMLKNASNLGSRFGNAKYL